MQACRRSSRADVARCRGALSSKQGQVYKPRPLAWRPAPSSSRKAADMPQSTAAASNPESGHGAQQQHFWALALGSIGVVYGDIGTSPLYALKEAVTAATRQGAAGPD